MSSHKSYLSLLVCIYTISLLASSRLVNPTIDVTGKYMNFDEFQIQYQKKYATPEETSLRKLAYEINLKRLIAQNCTACGVNSMFDMTAQQLSRLNGVNVKGMKFTDPQNLQTSNNGTKTGKSLTTQPIGATSLDWRTKSALTPVRNQGNCGSCWAFAAAAYTETWMVRNMGKTTSIDLAEQQLVECEKTSSGCNGGYSDTAMAYILKNGIAAETTDKYIAPTLYGNICSATNEFTLTTTQTFTTYFNSKRMSDAAIIALLDVQPLIIYVTANTWSLYKPVVGVSEIFNCRSSDSKSPNTLNHAVLLVGYGADYWLIKNSWGTSYGLSGYIKVSRSVTASCGVGFFLGYLK